MARQAIGIGAAANDGIGDPLRTAFQTTNANFTELYALLGGDALPLAAGASGAVPYFSSLGVLTASTLLAANALVIGGGAGAAPFTSANLTFGPAAGQGLTLALGTATTDVGNRYTQTWNAAGVTFTHEKHVITDTASAAGSLALQYLGGAAGTTNLLSLSKAGALRLANGTPSLPALTGINTDSGIAFSSTGIQIYGQTSSLVDINPSNFFRVTNVIPIGWPAGAANAGALETAISPISAGVIGVGTGAAGSFAGATKQTKLYLDYTNTATVGAVQIDKASGRVNLGAGGTTMTVTCAVCTAASHIFLNADSAPGNLVAVLLHAVPGAGSFTVNAVPAVTNQTAIDFVIINAD